MTFDAAVEQIPRWVHLASSAVVIVSVLAAAGVAPLWAIVPFLALSSMRHRLRSSLARFDVGPDVLAGAEREIPRSSIVDVWLDDDRDEPRIVVAFGSAVEVLSLRFETAIEAHRFRDALAANGDATERVVCGARPRLVDTLSSLRYLAIAGAFFATGSRAGLFVLLFFALGVWSLLRTRQVIVSRTNVTLRGLLGEKAYDVVDVKDVDVNDGVIRLSDGREIEIPSAVLRDATMTSAPWLIRARGRMLEAIQRGTSMALPDPKAP